MSILTAENLGISFGAFDLFRGISFTVANNAKIGLIGPNGIGKTSLLLLLAGINEPSSGVVHLARDRRLGYLRQEAVEAFADRSNTVYAEMMVLFRNLQEMQEQLQGLEKRMANEPYSEELLEKYGTLQEKFEHLGGYDYELRIQQTLQGLGLGKSIWTMPLNLLSGGQKTRALLARLLLEKPDLLMLDEPTNHLDIEAVEWLEHTLSEWDGAVIIVSHDRFFLDNTVNTIWEMSPRGIESYNGSYSAYLLQRQERWEYYERVFEEEKERLLKQVDFIQRNWVRASTHARALGLLRRLTRDLAIVDNYGIMALRDGRKWSETGLTADRPLDVIEAVRKVNAIQMIGSRPPVIRPRLHAAHTGGNIVLRGDHAEVGYPGHKLFSIHDLELHRGECAALIGPNGSGKTTFLKVLLNQVHLLSGEVRLGAGLKIGYFAQAHDSLNADLSVIDEFIRHKEMLPGEARSYLAQYLFRNEDVFKPVEALSGGERARLALAILALEGSNLLLLDEPTNHLDIPAREALQEVLENYNGTVLLVSHDRYLIDRLASQIWEIKDEKLQIFRGSYREYLLRAAGSDFVSSKARQAVQLSRPMVRDNSRDTRRREERLNLLEGRIHDQENILRKAIHDLQAAGEKGAYEQIHQLSWQVSQAQAALDELMAEWEKFAVA